MAFADVGDVRLFYTDSGSDAAKSGPPILFCHGFSCDSHDWSWQLPFFEQNHRVVAVDIRGHGRSSVPDKGYEPRQFAADIAGLLDQLGTGPVVAIGHSLGGVIVTALAVEHPGLVQAVVCVDPGYLLPEVFRPVVLEMVDSLKSGDPIDGSQTFLSASYSPSSPAALKTWHMRRIAGTPPHVLVQTLAGMFDGDDALGWQAASVPYVKRRQSPVFALYTDPDRAAFEGSLAVDERSKSYAWPGSGHWPHQERPEEFNHLVSGWLAGL